MRRNTRSTADRRTTTRTPAPGPASDREPRRTTAGLVAATLVTAVVVAAAFAPVATATVAAVLGTFGVAMTATGRTEGDDRDAVPTDDPGDDRATPERVAAD